MAELLWSGHWPEPGARAPWPRPVVPLAQLSRLVPDGARPLEVMPLLVQVAALADPDRGDPRPDAIVARGRRLIALLAAGLAPALGAAAFTRALGAGSIAEIAARALGLSDDASPLIERALVLLADHELNASSFAARIAASTDADPYACVAAALAVVSGVRHGTAPEEIARFADEIGGPEARAPRSARGGGAGSCRRSSGTLYPEEIRGRRRCSRRRAARARAGRGRCSRSSTRRRTPSLPPTWGSPRWWQRRRAAGGRVGALRGRARGGLDRARPRATRGGGLLRPRARYTGVPVIDA